MFGAGRYLRAAWLNIGPAAFDVSFVAGISLVPLFLARLTPLIEGKEPNLGEGWFWALLTNGQLAFYALGTLAVIALIVFKGDTLPKVLRNAFGATIVFFLIFISYLIGVDPTLESAPKTFVGEAAFWIYLLTQVMAVTTAAYDKFGLNDIASESSKDLRRLQRELAEKRADQNG